MDQLTIFGACGALLILIAFVLNQLHKWRDDYFWYDLFNLIGSLILVIYAVLLSSWPFAILNAVWAIVSLRDVFIDLGEDKSKSRRSIFRKWMQ